MGILTGHPVNSNPVNSNGMGTVRLPHHVPSAPAGPHQLNAVPADRIEEVNIYYVILKWTS